MKKIFKSLILLLLVGINITAQVPAAVVPDFKFEKQDKTIFTNKNLAPGKIIFFVFFDADCEHCQHAISFLNQHFADAKKAAVYLITLDSEDKAGRFIATYGNHLKAQKNITFLRDFQNEFIMKFKPKKYPSMFLYSPQKKLLMYDDNEKNMVNFLTRIKASGKK